MEKYSDFRQITPRKSQFHQLLAEKITNFVKRNQNKLILSKITGKNANFVKKLWENAYRQGIAEKNANSVK